MLFLIRGLPGSGKTSFARDIGEGEVEVLEADDFFYVGREYRFDPKKLGQAHEYCRTRCEALLRDKVWASVANTFTQRWEMEPYLKIAKEAGIRVHVVSLFDGGLTDEELFERNSHGVPLKTIASMRARYEHDWKNGAVAPPWGSK